MWSAVNTESELLQALKDAPEWTDGAIKFASVGEKSE
jgi:hypothetical protein